MGERRVTSFVERRSGTDLTRALQRGLVDYTAWPIHGAVAGAIGAVAIALVFEAIDVARGNPLWTPYALGSLLFLGRWPVRDASPLSIVTIGYVAVHFGVFAGFTPIAAHMISLLRRPVPIWAVFLFLFACIEASFLGLGLVFLPGVVSLLGGGRVAAANALAAASMAAYLCWFAWPRALRRPE